MQKYLNKISTLLYTALFLTLLTCKTAVIHQQVEPNYKLISHKGVLAGKKVSALIADAMTETTRGLSEKYFPKSYVFVSTATGNDLDFIKAWADDFNAPSEISKQIQTQVSYYGERNLAGDADSTEKILEVGAKIMSETTISGIQKENDWWFELESLEEPKKKSFMYVSIYSIPKTTLDQYIENAIRNAAEREALDLEKEALDLEKTQTLIDGLKQQDYNGTEYTPPFTKGVFNESNAES